MRRFQTFGPGLVVIAAVAVALLAGPVTARRVLTARAATLATLAQDRLAGDNILEQISRAKRDIAKAVEPSVVYIEADIRGGRGQSNGSGWIYSRDGYVVTNAHVVLSASRVRVQLFDGRVHEATVVGVDESTDIAVLKVKGGDTLIPAKRASSQPVSQGDSVFAFGSPFGFKFSMSEGIVSGLGRHARTTLTGSSGYTNYIQTDAAVNPGNSGGPLVNYRGQVVGMNTAIITRDEVLNSQNRADTGVSGGVSFAIPMDTIESVVGQMIARGYVLKGYLGVYLDPLNLAAAEQAGFSERGGVVITGLQEGTPASVSGLRKSDIITAVNGTLTPNLTVLRSVISNREPGETIRVHVWRSGEDFDLPVTLAAAAVVGDQLQPLSLAQTIELGAEEAAFAHVVTSLARFGLTEFDDGVGGVLIKQVREGSAASQLGFENGYLIRSVAGQPATSRDTMLKVLAGQMMEGGAGSVAATAVDPASGRTVGDLRIILSE